MFDRCIYFSLNTLTRKINKIWQQEFERLGLSPSHGYLLFAIAEQPEATQKDLSEMMELDASTITRLMDKLEHKGFIEKLSRGKGARFAVTHEGKTHYQAISKVMDALYANMQKRFGPEHFKHFVEDLHRAKQTLDEE